jgi:hypothetical protein
VGAARVSAEYLHQRFGDDAHLTVGALPYPPGSRPEPPLSSGPAVEPLDPREVTAELDGP